MSSDRARDSFDESRKYTGVVAQQGRVTLEADINEQQRIASENTRAETLDIVGPCGTPDDGFAVMDSGTPPDFAVGPGTMYVGGLRVSAAEKIDYAKQPEWLDFSDDPLWSDSEGSGREFVYLFLREQEVGAVEDQPLREVALGGPDTAQRTRLVQRIVRQEVETDQCSTALEIAQKKWSELGLVFDPHTMRLNSHATLQVQFVQSTVAATQCDPQVKGGYLAADNQMIRVQISGHDPKTGGWRLLWGYNNASFLHRVTAVGNSALKITAKPVDSYHAPRANHAVEVLRSAVDLTEENYVAAHSGFVFTPTQPYVTDTQTLSLPAGSVLPPSYTGDPQLFLRLWEEELSFTPGSPLDLKGTGLRITVALNSPAGALSVGQFWTFAVRPSTPVAIYPQRYFDAPQPPEGPRMWACPLAVIAFPERKFQLVSDCREKFDNLVDLTKRRSGCCSIVIKPEDVAGGKGLQALLDGVGPNATVSLMPGVYQLPQTLFLTEKHQGLTLEGCHDGAQLVAVKGLESHFLFGLVAVAAANEITLRNLRIGLPLFHFGKIDAGEIPIDEYVSTGVLAIQSADLCIEDCLFRFATPANSIVLAVGVHAAGECANLCVIQNRFLHTSDYKRGLHFLAGFHAGLDTEQKGATKDAGGQNSIVPFLENARICGNEFGGLTLAVYVRGEMGRLRCEDNEVHDCDGGFYFLSADQQFSRERVLNAMLRRNESDLHQEVYSDLLQSAQIRVAQSAYQFAKVSPVPAGIAKGSRVIVGKVHDSGVTKTVRAAAVKANDLRYSQTDTGARLKAAQAEPAQAAAPKQNAADDKKTAEELRESMVSYLTMPADNLERSPNTPAIRFGGNDVELIPYEENALRNSMPMLGLLTQFAGFGGSSVIMTANDIRGDSPSYLADLEAVQNITTTGNLVLNTRHSDSTTLGGSMKIDAEGALMNVAGNAFMGGYNFVPAKPTDAGCSADDWNQLNSYRIV